jgi:hypothetical protein
MKKIGLICCILSFSFVSAAIGEVSPTSVSYSVPSTALTPKRDHLADFKRIAQQKICFCKIPGDGGCSVSTSLPNGSNCYCSGCGPGERCNGSLVNCK